MALKSESGGDRASRLEVAQGLGWCGEGSNVRTRRSLETVRPKGGLGGSACVRPREQTSVRRPRHKAGAWHSRKLHVLVITDMDKTRYEFPPTAESLRQRPPQTRFQALGESRRRPWAAGQMAKAHGPLNTFVRAALGMVWSGGVADCVWALP